VLRSLHELCRWLSAMYGVEMGLVRSPVLLEVLLFVQHFRVGDQCGRSHKTPVQG
jgi:hypothetical protein